MNDIYIYILTCCTATIGSRNLIYLLYIFALFLQVYDCSQNFEKHFVRISPSVLKEQLIFHWTGLRDIGQWRIFGKSVEVVQVIGKAIPSQAWSDPEGSKKFIFPNYMTTAQDVGYFFSPTHRPP